MKNKQWVHYWLLLFYNFYHCILWSQRTISVSLMVNCGFIASKIDPYTSFIVTVKLLFEADHLVFSYNSGCNWLCLLSPKLFKWFVDTMVNNYRFDQKLQKGLQHLQDQIILVVTFKCLPLQMMPWVNLKFHRYFRQQ